MIFELVDVVVVAPVPVIGELREDLFELTGPADEAGG